MSTVTSDGETRPGLPSDGDELEFSQYVAARQAALLRFAYLITSDHHAAEDLVQTALAKTFLAWRRVRDHRALDAYVRKIIVNEHTSIWRRAWKRREVSTDQVPDHGRDDPATGLRDELWVLVQTLPPRQRAALVLRYFEDLSEAETAEILGCSVGTVKSQTSRALATLRTRVTTDLAGGDS